MEALKIPIRLYWRDRHSGKSGIYETTEDVNVGCGCGCPNEFWWSEGNGGCPCNLAVTLGLASYEEMSNADETYPYWCYTDNIELYRYEWLRNGEWVLHHYWRNED